MSQDDPFELPPDPDRTILVPTPGAGRVSPTPPAEESPGIQPALTPEPFLKDPYQQQSAAQQPVAPSMQGPQGGETRNLRPAEHHEFPRSGLNPLVQAANALLDLVAPLRQMVSHPDISTLRLQLIQAVKQFEELARRSSTDAESIGAGRYALCTLVDETIAGTPWGGGIWGGQSLLVHFHNEASGGEKFFLILQRLAQDPKRNLHLLELFYLCLSLGLQGRYRIANNGAAQLESLRERLARLIADERGPVEHELSPRWRGIVDTSKSMARIIPLWVYLAVGAFLLAAIQLGLNLFLNQQSDEAFTRLRSISVAQITPVRRTTPGIKPALSPAPTELATFLAPEIEQQLVSVSEKDGRTKITIRGDGLFASGSTRVSAPFLPLMARIAAALDATDGRIVVIGHTDNVRIVSARFPSNWHLSNARAASVVKSLAAGSKTPARFKAEGRGATEPLVPNDTKANRAKNRRVDIVVTSERLS